MDKYTYIEYVLRPQIVSYIGTLRLKYILCRCMEP